MLSTEMPFLGSGSDYRVFVDQNSSQRVIKIPRKERGHPTRFQAKYDNHALKRHFSPCTTGEHSFHEAGDGIQDFFWRQRMTQERQPLTLATLFEHRKQFLEILDRNEQMMTSAGTSLDFFGYKCLHRQTWFPEKDTVLSDNLAICSDRGLVIEDLGLLHFKQNPMVQIPHKHIFSYAIHRKIEQALLLQLKKRI